VPSALLDFARRNSQADLMRDSRAARSVCLAAVLAAVGCSQRDPPAIMIDNSGGRILRWKAPEIVLTPMSEVGGTRPPPELGVALQRAAQRWNRALGKCGAPLLLANRETLDRPAILDDRVNAVLLHERSWCPPGVVEPDQCYPADLRGRTHVFPRLEDAEIVGADVELNAVTAGPAAATSRALDELEASLVHELGHVLGLDHPCGPNGRWNRSGQGLASCDSPAMRRQVMHPSWAAWAHGDDLTPTAEEVAAVCEAYRQP